MQRSSGLFQRGVCNVFHLAQEEAGEESGHDEDQHNHGQAHQPVVGGKEIDHQLHGASLLSFRSLAACLTMAARSGRGLVLHQALAAVALRQSKLARMEDPQSWRAFSGTFALKLPEFRPEEGGVANLLSQKGQGYFCGNGADIGLSLAALH